MAYQNAPDIVVPKSNTDVDVVHHVMGDSRVFGLFPYPVHITEYSESLEAEKVLLSGFDYELAKTGHHKITTNGYILDEDGFSKINKFIKKALNHYCDEVLHVDSQLGITQSWANQSNSGDQIHPHGHPNSMVSGVFYFESTMDVPLIFVRGTDQEMWGARTWLGANAFNEFNCGWLKLPLEGPAVVLFPSKIEHLVEPNRTGTTRYSLSFNTFPCERFGDPAHLTCIDFKRLLRNKE